jgi:hypothetical protein
MTSTGKQIAIAVILFSMALAIAACGGEDDGSGTDLPQGSESVDLDPADFTTRIDNPYRPLLPGAHWTYRDTDTDGTVSRVDVRVTSSTKKLANAIDARIVIEAVREDGELVEQENDWYAQDSAGNVWYLGEQAREYENGKVKATSTWQAGVDGAQPGVVMPAEPAAGLAYRQSHYAGKEEDRADVLSSKERVEAPAGYFTHAVAVREFSLLEPRLVEYKLFARGVGLVRVFQVSGGTAHEELLRYSKGK